MSTTSEQIQSLFPHAKFPVDQDGAAKFTIDNSAPASEKKTLLTTKGLLKITGEQRLKFLQGQSTFDSTKLTPEQASFGAFCNLKGRAIANFLAYDDGTSSFLIMHQSLISDLIEHLTKFAVFFRVTLEQDSNLVIGGLLHEENGKNFLESDANEQEVRIALESNRSLVITDINSLKATLHETEWFSESYWNQHDMAQGIAWTSKSTSEEFLPQLLGLEEIEGLSFSKGCYTGQEIIARMKYRGQLKRHLRYAKLAPTQEDGDLASLQYLIGFKIDSDNKKNAGQIINCEVLETCVLTLLTLEDESMDAEEVKIDEKAFKIKLLPMKTK